MEEIIETSLIEIEKSPFLIDIVKHRTGRYFVNIRQSITIDSEKISHQDIKINPLVLSDIIDVLKNYQTSLQKIDPEVIQHLTFNRIKEIEKRYLKGVSLEDLSLQFDTPTQQIRQILENRGIAIVSNNPPKTQKRYFKYKNKKK